MTPAIPISLSPFLPSPDDVTLRYVALWIVVIAHTHTHTGTDQQRQDEEGKVNLILGQRRRQDSQDTKRENVRRPLPTDERTNEQTTGQRSVPNKKEAWKRVERGEKRRRNHQSRRRRLKFNIRSSSSSPPSSITSMTTMQRRR